MERNLQSAGYHAVAGLDEAGRGSWAGPLVAAAVILPDKLDIVGIRDSKLLSPRQRDELFAQLMEIAIWTTAIISVEDIDTHGVGWANQRALENALAALKPSADVALVDGNLTLATALPYQSIVDGDNSVFVIAAASIIAKVTRDRLMDELHKDYPEYGFAQHRGYGTAAHAAALERFGPLPCHRRSFAPIRALNG